MIVGYVLLFVWVWWFGCVCKMSVYVDELLVLLLFEFEVYKKLGGLCMYYVGYLLSENVVEFCLVGDEWGLFDVVE